MYTDPSIHVEIVRQRHEQRRAYLRFKQALLEFSDAPKAPNIARYLAASKALDDSSRTSDRNTTMKTRC
jgi:hypothetical protein